jgi:hypothetical protein
LDEQRVTDLQMLQSQIVSVYWQSKGALPGTLADLQDPINGFQVPKDPQTAQQYEYIRKGERMFALCATFAAVGADPAWPHEAGRVCFDRTIDVQLYPVRSPQPLVK